MADSSYLHDEHLHDLVEAAARELEESDRRHKRKRSAVHDGLTDLELIQSEPQRSQSPRDKNSPRPVIFRPVSEKSKRHSRPPLSKVFTSLELAPELYLRMETDAKEFMLDPAHLDRRNVISQGRSTSGIGDAAKLKLWDVAEQFLNGGAGEMYFGQTANFGIPHAPQRTQFWPEDAHAITRLMMPLLRKMVSNERQRLYADRARRIKAGKPVEDMNDQYGETAPSLESGPEQFPRGSAANGSSALPISAVKLLVNVLKPSETGQLKRIIPRVDIPSSAVTGIDDLKERVKGRVAVMRLGSDQAGNVDIDKCEIKAWLQDGLVDIKCDGDWLVAVASAESVEWMDLEVRIMMVL